MTGQSTPPASQLLLLAAGFAVWASAFVALYAMLSVGCRFGWQEIDLAGGLSFQRAQLLAILVLHLGAGVWLAWRLRGKTMAKGTAELFVRRAAYAAAVTAAAATLFSFAGVIFLSTCH